MNKISVVINTLNEEKNIEKVLGSVKWADEIVIVDDGSTDKTIDLAKKYTKKIYHHKGVGYVEPARNFALSKATNEWILLLDADEEVPIALAKRLQDISIEMKDINYVEIPRKNIIFGKWMKASMWWPDYNIRFFRKGSVVWKDKIHSKPDLSGLEIKLEEKEELAIVHHNYDDLSQFIKRMDKYSTIQASELIDSGLKFHWSDLIIKPLEEFLSRFFAHRGFEDGVHGLSLSLLQAFSFLVVYLKVWEKQKFVSQEITIKDIKQLSKRSGLQIDYWIKYANLSKNPFKRFLQKAKNKVS